jgi:class 3 adenylate cyclase
VNIPETRYARSNDGAYIAYQVFGQGDVDLLWIAPWFSHLELLWEHPPIARFHREMASIARLIMLDQRGVGLSDRSKGLPDLETRMDDLRAVLDAAGSKRTVLWGAGVDGGALCAMFAATYPERVVALAFWNAQAKAMRAPDYPFGTDPSEANAWETTLGEGWGLEERTGSLMTELGAPSIAIDPVAIRWAAKTCRNMGSPGDVIAFNRMFDELDFRAVCPSIHVPTLAIFAEEPEYPDAVRAREDLAARIPGATTARVSAGDFPPWPSNIESAVGALRDFVRATQDEEESFDRVLATVLFTDIVDSTATAAVLGDARWRRLIDEHDRAGKAIVARYRGEYVHTTGDGLLATFDGPARAIRCAQSIIEAGRPLGVEIRAGLHTGEIERAEHGVAGVGVHIGARVGALAGGGEVWVSSTVKDLTAGSGLAFEDRGEHTLKGVPDRWHLYRVVQTPG